MYFETLQVICIEVKNNLNLTPDIKINKDEAEG